MAEPPLPNGKHLGPSGLKALPSFVFSAVVGVPLFIALLPFSVGSAVFAKFFGSRQKLPPPPPATKQDIQKGKSDREFDLILYGATGFTGKLAAQYIAQRYGADTFRWAIAGRRESALAAVRDELVKICPNLCDLTIIIADGSDDAALLKMAQQTRVVVTAAGPFQRYGSRLVRACAISGTHYADTTGETDWVRQMISMYDDVARASGARIVPMCGHDCIPWDLLALDLATALREKNEDTKEVRFYDERRSAPSGGTLETIRTVLTTSPPLIEPKPAFDPLLRTASGEKSTFGTRGQNAKTLGYSSERGAWIGPDIMAAVMANCVRRSNALLGWGKNLVYSESCVYPGFFSGFSQCLTLYTFGVVLTIPPLRNLLYKSLPAPGTGPSTEEMDKSFLRVFGFGVGSKGTIVRNSMFIPDDPGYRDTARMLVEAGLSLLHLAKTPADAAKYSSGVVTSASGVGHVLINRLREKGTTIVAASQQFK